MKKLTILWSYVLEFTVCAFCGWLYEEGLELAVNHAYADRGVLHLPVLPIYGFFGLILVVLFRKHNHWLFVFLASTIVTTVLELACSYPIERILGYLPWYYIDWPLNFEGRISLFSSLIFGGLALLLVKLVHPLMRRFAAAAPEGLLWGLGIGCALCIVVDAVWSI